tara:strand:+ start:289 stop:543 length:255 start_codon:yes stop_codon:yes gene_type:complete
MVARIFNLQVMAKAATLNKIGSRVQVLLEQVKDRIPAELIKKLSTNPMGKVIGYKMTDGYDIGLVVELNDGSQSWFFSNEIKNF